ncbi:DUF4129 domain-containing protein [Cohnella terricola]|uniref:DUF4129 domain-containing protein n=1 Tax=Cohnella terricola TaxID=1289167 RepID=A0A559JIX4_9BACL|nr:DUF4129 domain-containing protein [Cohnella terricola]TVX99816.1 DUF4129 domain-containing protein [Cohnella terricola]
MIDRAELLKDKQRLGEILSRDEYTKYLKESVPHKGWLESLWDGLVELFSFVHWPEGTAKVGAYALLGVVAIVLCGAIYWFSRQIVFQGNARRLKTPVGLSEMALTYGQYAKMAKEAHSEGRIRESIRCSYLSLLFYMEQEGWIRIEKWKTDWDYRDELERSRANAVPYFQRSALLFERVWYGNEPADEASFLDFQRDIDELIAVREAK